MVWMSLRRSIAGVRPVWSTQALRGALAILVAGCMPAAFAARPVAGGPELGGETDDRAECVGLVLGGGGARGAAHVGVLRILEREHVPICWISGTSMGAIVGGLYAAGYSTDELARLIDTLDWTALFTDAPTRPALPMRRKDADFRYLLKLELGYADGKVVLPGGLVQGQKLLMLLRRLTLSTWDVQDFDALPIPFRAVAADIGSGDKVVFDHGDLAIAIRASMSVPGAFAPLQVDGRLLVDGGMVDNVPVDEVRAMGAQRLVVVDVGSPLHDPAALTNPLVIMDQMIGALMREKTARQLATLGPGDVLIRPDLGDISAAQFNRGPEAIEQGERAAEAALGSLQALTVDAGTYARYRARQRQRRFDPGLVAFLQIDPGAGIATERTIARAFRDQLGQPLDPDRIERSVGDAYGSSHLQQLDYRLVERDGQRGLELRPVNHPWRSFSRFGFQLSDDFNGRNSYLASMETTVTDLNPLGAEWLTVLRAGQIGGLHSEFHQPLGDGSRFYLQPALTWQNETYPRWRDGAQLAEYRVNAQQVALEFGYLPDPRLRLSAGAVRGRDRGDVLIGHPDDISGDRQDYVGLRYSMTWDSLDTIDFPSRGLRMHAQLTDFRDARRGDVQGNLAALSLDWAHAWGRYRLLLGAYLQSAVDDSHAFQTQQFLGGFLNLSGFHERALSGNQSALLRAVAYRRTGDLSRLFSLPVYVGASLEFGNTWPSLHAVAADDLIVAASAFAGVDTPLGPMFLAYGYNDQNEGSWYLTFGSLLRPREH